MSVGERIRYLRKLNGVKSQEELAGYFADNAPRGEIVIVVEGKKQEKEGKKDKYAKFKTDKKPIL